MIRRVFAAVLVVLIALPFTAPFVTCDLHDLTTSARPAEVSLTLSAPTPAGTQDDAPVWFERSDPHHSMELSGLNGSGFSSAFFLSTRPLFPPAAMSPSDPTSAIATVLRV